MFPFQQNKYLITVYLILFLSLLFIVSFYQKENIHLFINQLNNPFSDNIFKIITFFGDGIFVILVSLLFLLKKIRYTFYVLSVYIFSGIFVQLGKRIIWPDAPRPSAVFGEGILHLVNGIKLHSAHSFPSGHTASAFGLFFILCFFIKNKMLKWTFFSMAILVGYSRIYLNQHFLIDVLAGSAIGVICAIISYLTINKIKAQWLDKSLITKK